MIQDAAAIATAVGVLFALIGIRQVQRQRLRQFEDFYVARYWKIMDQFSLRVLRGNGTGQISRDDEKAVYGYLRLCEDEFDLRREGWISNSSWIFWTDGMLAQLERWPFIEIWEKIRPEQFQNLCEFWADHKYDPIEIGRLRVWLRGLNRRGL
jgi:hypothetical protein